MLQWASRPRHSLGFLARRRVAHYAWHRPCFSKHAFIEIEAAVFGGSPVKISIRLESDDKPNSAGSVVDLIRIAKASEANGRAIEPAEST